MGNKQANMNGFNAKDLTSGKSWGKESTEGETTNSVAAGSNDYYCTLTKQYYSDSTCTSAVQYTHKSAEYFNQCVSMSAGGSQFITACNTTGWNVNVYSGSGCTTLVS